MAQAGLEVELGTRTAEQRDRLAATRTNERYLPGVALPDAVRVVRAADLDLAHADLVALAVPARDLPAAVASLGDRIPPQAAVLARHEGPGARRRRAPERLRRAARAGACAGASSAAPATRPTPSPTAPPWSPPPPTRTCARSSRELLSGAGFAVETTTDVAGVELAAAAKNAAVLAAATAAVVGPNAAGAAAGRVFAELDAYARRHGGRAETFAGLAGAGDLVATVVADASRNRRAGELLGQGVPAERIGPMLGQACEGLDALPLLARTLAEDGVRAPTVDGPGRRRGGAHVGGGVGPLGHRAPPGAAGTAPPEG